MKTRTTTRRTFVGVPVIAQPHRHPTTLKRLAFSAFAIFAAASVQAAQTWYVAAATGSDSNDGLTAETAFQTIQKAINSASWGDRVLVGDGIYAPISAANQLLTIESVNGPGSTVIDGGYPEREERCATLGEETDYWRTTDCTNTVLRGFTIRNGCVQGAGGGALFGTLENCIVSNNIAMVGGGSCNGNRFNCLFTGNTVTNFGQSIRNHYGAGAAYGLMVDCVVSNHVVSFFYTATADTYAIEALYEIEARRCVIAENSAGIYCGSATACRIVRNGGYGVSGATAKNCVLANNRCGASSSTCINCVLENNRRGASSSTCINCTIVGNESDSDEGGGTRYGTSRNCIYSGNTRNGEPDDLYRTTVTYSCFRSTEFIRGDGTGNIDLDPKFLNAEENDYRLALDSPCVNKGDPDDLDFDVDFTGGRRIVDGRIDMGAFESDLPDTFGVRADKPVGGMLEPLVAVVGPGESVTFRACGPRPFLAFYTNGVVATTRPKITLENSSDDIVLSATFGRLDKSCDIYVNDDAPDNLMGGADPDHPLPTIQAAIECALSGDSIHVAEGTYGPIESNGKNLRISSESGAETTIVDGNETQTCATFGEPGQIVVTGLTFQNGKNGVFGGRLENCIVQDNVGVGASSSSLFDCIIRRNDEGGVAECVAERCEISDNSASEGGGSWKGTNILCTISGNTAWQGGGTYSSVNIGCTIVGNSAGGGGQGGGVFDGECQNCLIVRNCAEYGGGAFGDCGAYGERNRVMVPELSLVNCTIVDNVASKAGGGVYALTADNSESGDRAQLAVARIANSIIWDNFTDYGELDNYSGGYRWADYLYWEEYESLTYDGFHFRNSCTMPNPDSLFIDGFGNLSEPPRFNNPNENDFSLAADSPCIDRSGLTQLQETAWLIDTIDAVFDEDEYFIIGFTGEISWHATERETPIDFSGPDAAGNARRIYGGVDMGAFERQHMPVSMLPFASVWGDWSDSAVSAPTMPDSINSPEMFARGLWSYRDNVVRQGRRTEIPPTSEPFVLSLGAIPVSPNVLSDQENELPAEEAFGVPVYRFRLFENPETGMLTGRTGTNSIDFCAVPFYLPDEWVESVYGEPPGWLSGEERNVWYSQRCRSRIEWAATLVPQEYWDLFVANREVVLQDAFDETLETSLFEISEIAPDVASNDFHRISILCESDGDIRVFGSDELSGANWFFKGVFRNPDGASDAGFVSTNSCQFVFAAQGGGDFDSDGIPDVVERFSTGSDERRNDTSGDGLSDWDKVFRYDLDPSRYDSAGDGFSDAEKMAVGLDPRRPIPLESLNSARRSIRYAYDADDRLVGTWFGLQGGSETTEFSRSGNPETILEKDSAQ